MSEGGEMSVRPAPEPKSVTQRIKSGVTTGVNKFLRRPQLTPEQQAEEDLANEMLRNAEIKHRSDRKANEKEDVAERAEAQARFENSLGRLRSATEDLNPRPISKEKIERFEQKMAELKTKQEAERRERLTKIRAKVEQLRKENDTAEKEDS